jgi:hypothetical protein
MSKFEADSHKLTWWFCPAARPLPELLYFTESAQILGGVWATRDHGRYDIEPGSQLMEEALSQRFSWAGCPAGPSHIARFSYGMDA